MQEELLDQLEIATVIQNWALWRDSADWDKLRTAVHPDAIMTATWFHGRFDEFIEASRASWRKGTRSQHALGGTAIELNRTRAVAQTRLTLVLRAPLDGTEVEVTCRGRFFDRLEKREGVWRIARRSVIYEMDRIDTLEPGAGLELDRAQLERYPEGYRYLAYVQTRAGTKVPRDLPTADPESQKMLIREARAWLAAAPH